MIARDIIASGRSFTYGELERQPLDNGCGPVRPIRLVAHPAWTRMGATASDPGARAARNRDVPV